MKDYTNGIKPIGVFKIWKHVLGVRKPSESDMDMFNSCGDQVTDFNPTTSIDVLDFCPVLGVFPIWILY